MRGLRAALVAALLLGLPGAALQQPPGPPDASLRPIGPGTRLLSWSAPGGPHALYAVEAGLSEPLLQLGVSLGRGEVLGLEPLSRQAARLTTESRYPIAAVNGDFFYYPNTANPGIPTGAAVLGEELIRTPFPRSALVLPARGTPTIVILGVRGTVARPDGRRQPLDHVNHPRGEGQLVLYTPRYGGSTRTSARGVETYLEPEPGNFPLRHGTTHRARVLAVQRGAGDGALNPGTWVLSAGAGPAAEFLLGLNPGDVVELRVDFDPPLAPGDQVLGGGPRLLRNGRVALEPEAGSVNGPFVTARHPRTAVGFNRERLFLVVVDGRQPGYSVGMTLPELAQAMLELGCTEALNLDGGGSTTLWVRGRILNRPSDGRERPVANGLLVYSTAPRGAPVRLAPEPSEIAALPGAVVPLAAAGEDEHYNPVTVPGDTLAWSVDPALGTVLEGRFLAGAVEPDPGQEFRAGSLQVSSGMLRGAATVRVYPRPARVELYPTMVSLAPGRTASFRARAVDSRGRPLLLPARLEWSVSPGLGAIDGDGLLRAGDQPGRGTVRVTLQGVTAEALVELSAAAARPLADFEDEAAARTWKLRLGPGAIGTATVTEMAARSGRRALALRYDFSSGSGTRALYATSSLPLGAATALTVWARGDGQGAWLRARVRDAAGTLHTLDLARRVDWQDEWRELRAPLPAGAPGPFVLEALYLTETDADRRPRGLVLLDDVGVER